MAGSPHKTTGIYQMFYARAYIKALFTALSYNLQISGLSVAANVEDPEEAFNRILRNYKVTNLKELVKLPFMQIDMTPVYTFFGGDARVRKYYSLLGHLQDPVKWGVHIPRSVRGKMSPLSSMALDILTQTNWQNKRFKTLGEFIEGFEAMDLGTWGTTTHDRSHNVSTTWMMPVIVAHELYKLIPIMGQASIQGSINGLAGEKSAWDEVMNSAGVHVTTIKPEKRKGMRRRKAQ